MLRANQVHDRGRTAGAALIGNMGFARRVSLLACAGIFLWSTPFALAQPGGGGSGPGSDDTDNEDLTEECDTSGASADYTEELRFVNRICRYISVVPEMLK